MRRRMKMMTMMTMSTALRSRNLFCALSTPQRYVASMVQTSCPSLIIVHSQNYQQALDITIGEDERVLFKVTGTHSIFLTGNYVEPAGRSGVDDYDEDDEDDQYGYDLEPDSDEELDYDEEEDELDDIEDPRITEVDDDEAPVLAKAEKKGKNKRAAEEEIDGSGLDALITKAREADASDAKLSKKQKKQKKNDGTAAAVEEKKEVANGSAKSDKKVQFAKNLEQGPTPTKESKEQSKGVLGIKKVQGVTIDDKKIGTGPAAKNGDRVGMRYIGKLEKNNQVFDSNKKGKPFTFKLGSGEVIKGWDIGIAGMTVGGERRITIPAHLAYGSKKNGEIPANSTLVFDVKLLDINRSK
jgi:FK506-binding nuclear protein